MKNLITYEDFIVLEKSVGERVCIFPGRFQPFHLGHIAALREASMRFQCPVVPIQIKSKSEDSPFPDSLLQKLGDAIAKEFEFIEKYVLYPTNLKTVVPQMVKLLREQHNLEAIGMGCGSDRQKAYEPQLKYLNSDRSDVPVSEPFRMEMVDERVPGGPSGTKVREAIANDDEALFKQLTPSSIHKYYKEMKKYL
jgi:phosphopantetheine adenylyltransferase